MSFVLPKPYMLAPMFAWGNELLNENSLTPEAVSNYENSIHAHGLGDAEQLSNIVSQMHSKVAEGTLAKAVDGLNVDETNASDMAWSDYDSDTNNMESLKADDVSDHLQHIDPAPRLKRANASKMNVRRSGRMRC